MTKELLAFHYFMRQKDPFLTVSELEYPSATNYASLKIPMKNYDEHYFEKRIFREAYCASFLRAHGGIVKTSHPYYFTLGNQDKIFFNNRHHKNSVAIPLSEFPRESILFVIGDSIGTSFELLKKNLFTYDDFFEHIKEIRKALKRVCGEDKYIEIQLWDEEPLKKYRPKYAADFGETTIVSNMVRIGLLANSKMNHSRFWKSEYSFTELQELMRSNELYLGWRTMWAKDIQRQYIPDGKIHGIPHSMRASLFALLLAQQKQLSNAESLFVSKCAVYHDAGRRFNCQDAHAEMSAELSRTIFSNSEGSVAAEVIRYHDRLSKYNVKIISDKKVRLYAKILHDADSLDYLRFGINSFTTKCLLLKESFNLVLLSCELNLLMWEFDNWSKTLSDFVRFEVK